MLTQTGDRVEQPTEQLQANLSSELPLNPKQQKVLDEINEVRRKVWVGVKSILQESIQIVSAKITIDGPSLVERQITPKLSFLNDLKDGKPTLDDLDIKTSKFYRQLMQEIYPALDQLDLFTAFKPYFVQATGDDAILKKLMDCVAKPIIKDFARSLDERGDLDLILSTAPEEI